MSKYNLTDILGEAFDSLVKKLDKQKGIDKEEAGKIAGSIAAKKMAGAGKGPTAKQKARMNEYDRSFYRNNINPEGERTVYRFVQNLAKKYGYGEQEAAYLIKQVGPDAVIELVRNMGITSPLMPVPSGPAGAAQS